MFGARACPTRDHMCCAGRASRSCACRVRSPDGRTIFQRGAASCVNSRCGKIALRCALDGVTVGVDDGVPRVVCALETLPTECPPKLPCGPCRVEVWRGSRELVLSWLRPWLRAAVVVLTARRLRRRRRVVHRHRRCAPPRRRPEPAGVARMDRMLRERRGHADGPRWGSTSCRSPWRARMVGRRRRASRPRAQRGAAPAARNR
jgi:hypothetical protein